MQFYYANRCTTETDNWYKLNFALLYYLIILESSCKNGQYEFHFYDFDHRRKSLDVFLWDTFIFSKMVTYAILSDCQMTCHLMSPVENLIIGCILQQCIRCVIKLDKRLNRYVEKVLLAGVHIN